MPGLRIAGGPWYRTADLRPGFQPFSQPHTDRRNIPRLRVNLPEQTCINPRTSSEPLTTPHDHDPPDFADLTGRVYRWCLMLIGRKADARDAAQEALLRAWSRRVDRRCDVSWWTWSAGFAVRVCREVGRKAVHSASDFDEPADAVLAENDRPAGASARLAAVHGAIQDLPDRQRETVVLRLVVGLSTQETARTLACPEGTVKSNLHKALNGLRGRLNICAAKL